MNIPTLREEKNHEMKYGLKVIKGHITPHSFMNANIMKTIFFLKMIKGNFMLLGGFGFLFRPSDLIITLTYVFMDNFCSCLLHSFSFK